jgi:hypothetical protein
MFLKRKSIFNLGKRGEGERKYREPTQGRAEEEEI